MARFATLTGLGGEEYYFNMDKISYLEKVRTCFVPGEYVATGNYEWTVVHMEGELEGVRVQEKVEDILIARKQ